MYCFVAMELRKYLNWLLKGEGIDCIFLLLFISFTQLGSTVSFPA